MRASSNHKLVWALIAAMAVVLTACASATPATTVPTSVATTAVPATGSVDASVRVEPSRSSDLGFLISAPVKQVLVHEGDTVKAGQPLILLDVPDLELGVEAAEQGLKAATQDEYIQSQGRRKWDGFKFVWVAGPPEQRTAAHAKVLQAQARLDAARAELDQGTLRAPFDGTLVSIRVLPGEVVQPGQIVATVGDLAQLRVETTDLSERDIARLHVGQDAQVTLEAFESPLSGSIVAIAPVAGRSPDGDVIYRVTIELQSQPKPLLWGMTGSVVIHTDS